MNRKVFFEIYEIKYPNVGYDSDGNKIDLLQVVTLPDCDNIITIFPKDQAYHETLEVDRKVNSGKVKSHKETKIDKFYDRYGKNNNM